MAGGGGRPPEDDDGIFGAIGDVVGDVVDTVGDAAGSAASAAAGVAGDVYTAAGGAPPSPTVTSRPRPTAPPALVDLSSPATSLAGLPSSIVDLLTPGAGEEEKPPTLADFVNRSGRVAADATDPAKAVISTTGPARPPANPGDPLGKKTLGRVPMGELARASERGALKLNDAGLIVTPRIRRGLRTLRAPLPGLDPEQTGVANIVLGEGLDAQAAPDDLLAGAMTGLVESNFRNLGYGDADSQGWRQERTSIYGTGPTGPRNVRASAGRFWDELATDAGTASAATPGLKAQAAQGSAFPERYDEQAPVAEPIVDAFTRRARLASHLGLRMPGDDGTKPGAVPKPRRMPGAVWFGKVAESPRFDLEVRENPFFDPVDPVHTEGSEHYKEYAPERGQAIDVVGDPDDLMRFNKWAARKYGEGLNELFYDPGISISEGAETSPIGGHSDHLHLAAAPGGTVDGGYSGGGGYGAAVGGGYAAAGAPIGPGVPAGGGGGVSPSAPVALTPLSSPLASGPTLPSDLLSAVEQGSGESAAQTILALLGEETLRPTRRPTL